MRAKRTLSPKFLKIKRKKVALFKAAGLKLQPKLSSWEEAFDALEEYIESLPEDKRKVIFIDEMPWIDTPQSEFVEAFESFWNSWGARRNDIVLIASGSASSWMVDKFVENIGGLHARITNNIYIRPFNLKETEEYLQSRGFRWSRYQILQLYQIMGGVPFYLSLLDPKQTLLANVDRLFFRRNAELKTEFDELFNAVFNKVDKYLEVVALLNSNHDGLTFTEIQKGTSLDGERLTTVLKNLERCDFIISSSNSGTSPGAPCTGLWTSIRCSITSLWMLLTARMKSGGHIITIPILWNPGRDMRLN